MPSCKTGLQGGEMMLFLVYLFSCIIGMVVAHNENAHCERIEYDNLPGNDGMTSPFVLLIYTGERDDS
jgi:hypothetical protein